MQKETSLRAYPDDHPDGDQPAVALNQKAYWILRESLLSGAFEPGSPLNLRPLASKMDMSPMPVREALSRLRSDGAVEALPNRAFRVPFLNADSYREVVLLRLRVESCACEKAAVMATSEDIKKVLGLYDKMLDIGETCIEEYLAVHRQFHFTIYEIARMPILTSVVEGLWLRIGPLLRASTRSRTAQDHKHHGAMTRALKASDPNALVAALRDDITDGVETVLTYLGEQGPPHLVSKDSRG
ncbi:GntR family transcriptional regulator [Sinorhizobium meliloti]|uniref:GntR family transcriptional regulator n=1 Tax=Rhizobium meliloti TaxID=382 RepID=UPI00398CCC93